MFSTVKTLCLTTSIFINVRTYKIYSKICIHNHIIIPYTGIKAKIDKDIWSYMYITVKLIFTYKLYHKFEHIESMTPS